MIFSFTRWAVGIPQVIALPHKAPLEHPPGHQHPHLLFWNMSFHMFHTKSRPHHTLKHVFYSFTLLVYSTMFCMNRLEYQACRPQWTWWGELYKLFKTWIEKSCIDYGYWLDLVVAGSQIRYHLVSGSFNMMNWANQFSSEGPATGYQKMDSSTFFYLSKWIPKSRCLTTQ